MWQRTDGVCAGGQDDAHAVPLLAAILLLLALASPALAHDPEVAGRGFTVATWPRNSGMPDEASVAVGTDDTVWVLLDGALWRVPPIAVAPVPVALAPTFSDLAVASDGALVLPDANERMVWRRGGDGLLTVVAGAPEPAAAGLTGGEGAQATQTPICIPGPVAGLPDGGFVFADREGRAIRRVAADGTISTLWAATPADRRYGCAPAPPDATDRVEDLAVERSGAVLVLLDGPAGPGSARRRVRIARVTRGGSLSVIADQLSTGSIAAASDGSVLVSTDSAGVGRLVPGARRPRTILPGDVDDEESESLFDRDGEPGRAYFGEFTGLAAAPDGGVISVLVGDLGAPAIAVPRVVYVAPPKPTRMAVALAPRSGRATRAGYSVRYRATLPGRARLTVRDRRGRVVAGARAPARAGMNTIRLPRRLRFGSYDVRLTAEAADGHPARDAIRVLLGGALPLDYARRLLVPATVDVGGGCSNCDLDERPVRREGCQRLSRRAVDCRYSYVPDDERVFVTASARLLLDGTLEYFRDDDAFGGGTLPRQP